jgi:hypothetical protein
MGHRTRWTAAAIPCLAILGATLGKAAQTVPSSQDIERRTLEEALLLAGPAIAKLPIELVSVAPDGASHGVEGWTTYHGDGRGERIFVYTGSAIFSCATRPGQNPESHQCVVRLASVLVHEAWHFRNGRQEAGAYTAQIAFLRANHAADAQIAAVQTARDRVLAAARKAAKAAKRQP